MNDELPLIVFVGPSYSGKSAISKYVSKELNLKRLNFDNLIKYHYGTITQNEDVLELLKIAKKNNYNIIDIGGNTINLFTKEDVKKLKETLGYDTIIYHIHPSKSPIISHAFLNSIVSQKASASPNISNKISYTCRQKYIVRTDLKSPVYELVKTEPTIYTLDNEVCCNSPWSITLKEYDLILKKIADKLVTNLKQKIIKSR